MSSSSERDPSVMAFMMSSSLSIVMLIDDFDEWQAGIIISVMLMNVSELYSRIIQARHHRKCIDVKKIHIPMGVVFKIISCTTLKVPWEFFCDKTKKIPMGKYVSPIYGGFGDITPVFHWGSLNIFKIINQNNPNSPYHAE